MILCFLPKKEGVGGAHAAEDARPLALGNTDCKVWASMLNIILKKVVAKQVACEQKGFVAGRCGNDHVVSLSSSATAICNFGAPAGAVMLFDIKAAFPRSTICICSML